MPPITTAISIRKMVLNDIEQVCEIDRQSFTLPWPENAFRHEIQSGKTSLCLVAEKKIHANNDRLVGIIVIWLVLDEAHIATIATHPEFRQQGIARELIVQGLRESFSRGARSATLEVRKSNQPAQNLYSHLGFEAVGRRVKYYRDNHEDALIMTLPTLNEAYINKLKDISGSKVLTRDTTENITKTTAEVKA